MKAAQARTDRRQNNKDSERQARHTSGKLTAQEPQWKYPSDFNFTRKVYEILVEPTSKCIQC